MRLNTISFQVVGVAAAIATVAVPNELTDHRLRLKFLVASYSGGSPTGGLLTITDGKLVDWLIDVPNTTPLVLPLPPEGLQLGAGAPLTVSLAAAGAGLIGKINGYCIFE